MNRALSIAHIGWVASCHLKRRVDALAVRGVRNVVFTDNIPEHFDPDDHDFAVELLPDSSVAPVDRLAWLEKRMADYGVDLLHAHSTHYPAALAYFVRSVPVINSIWDFVHSRDPFSPLYHRAILEELKSGRLADGISFSSKSLLDDWVMDGFPVERTFWHSWGVNFDLFVPGRYREEARNLRHQLGIGDEEYMLLSPRTPSLPANNDLAMQAVARLRDKHPVRLVITGHHIPREFRYIERLARREDVRNTVIFMDTVRDDREIATLYEASDAVLSLHNNDFNPATVLESFAMERPVVVNDLKTVNWWVEHGVNGFSAPARNLRATVDMLDHLLSLSAQERKELGKQGRSKIEENGNFTATMDQLPGDYASLMQLARTRSNELTHYDYGLLHDICGLHADASEHYSKAVSGKGDYSLVEELLHEKLASARSDNGIEYFCTQRCQPAVLAMVEGPESEWGKILASLPVAPMSLFRHDYCAALFPLLINGESERTLEVIDALADHYNTDTLEWVGETVTLFGCRFGLWEQGIALLRALEEPSPTLAFLFAEAAEALGSVHPDYANLIQQAVEWASPGLAHVNASLHKEFCEDIIARAQRDLTKA